MANTGGDTKRLTKADIALNRVDALISRTEKIEDLLPRITESMELVDILVENVNGVNVVELEKTLARLIQLIDGDDTRDIMGLRRQIRSLEKMVGDMVRQREQLKWIIFGTGLTGLANLIASYPDLVRLFAAILGSTP